MKKLIAVILLIGLSAEFVDSCSGGGSVKGNTLKDSNNVTFLKFKLMFLGRCCEVIDIVVDHNDESLHLQGIYEHSGDAVNGHFIYEAEPSGLYFLSSPNDTLNDNE